MQWRTHITCLNNWVIKLKVTCRGTPPPHHLGGGKGGVTKSSPHHFGVRGGMEGGGGQVTRLEVNPTPLGGQIIRGKPHINWGGGGGRGDTRRSTPHHTHTSHTHTFPCKMCTVTGPKMLHQLMLKIKTVQTVIFQCALAGRIRL